MSPLACLVRVVCCSRVCLRAVSQFIFDFVLFYVCVLAVLSCAGLLCVVLLLCASCVLVYIVLRVLIALCSSWFVLVFHDVP